MDPTRIEYTARKLIIGQIPRSGLHGIWLFLGLGIRIERQRELLLKYQAESHNRVGFSYPHNAQPEIIMQNRSRISTGAGWAFLMVFLSPCIAHACSILYTNVQVGTRFRVRVTDRGRPVKSLRVVLSSSESSKTKRVVTIYSVTDADGFA